MNVAARIVAEIGGEVLGLLAVVDVEAEVLLIVRQPAHEPCVLARKPMKGSLAANTLLHGVGGLNIDACRVPGAASPAVEMRKRARETGQAPTRPGHQGATITNRTSVETFGQHRSGEELGRYPANVIHDGSDAVLGVFPLTKTGRGTKKARGKNNIYTGNFGDNSDTGDMNPNGGDDGSAARYFYTAKASPKEREEGLDVWRSEEACPDAANDDGSGQAPRPADGSARVNVHPTVKPLALMEHLCKLVTPPGGLILDPFLGSGTTGVAAVKNGSRTPVEAS